MAFITWIGWKSGVEIFLMNNVWLNSWKFLHFVLVFCIMYCMPMRTGCHNYYSSEFSHFWVASFLYTCTKQWPVFVKMKCQKQSCTGSVFCEKRMIDAKKEMKLATNNQVWKIMSICVLQLKINCQFACWTGSSSFGFLACKCSWQINSQERI